MLSGGGLELFAENGVDSIIVRESRWWESQTNWPPPAMQASLISNR
jgi:hypothetical protein